MSPFQSDDQAALRGLILDGLASRFGFADESLTPDLDDLQVSYVEAGGEVWVATSAVDPTVDGGGIRNPSLTLTVYGEGNPFLLLPRLRGRLGGGSFHTSSTNWLRGRQEQKKVHLVS